MKKTFHASDIPLVILGVPFHNVTNDQAVAWCVRHVKAGMPGYVTTPNLDFVMQAQSDPELYRILAHSDLVIADGMPIVWLSRYVGPPLPERVAGSDLVVRLAEAAAGNGMSIFNLGGAPGVPEKAGEVLCGRFPGLKLAGAYSPPKADLLAMDHAAILQRLEEARPDILYVAFGGPKQEKWITMHLREWKVPLALGIGGSLDFLAGAQIRAPRWMQKTGTEWIWRFGTNPRRLWKRYGTNIVFLLRAGWMIWRVKHGAAEPLPVVMPPPELSGRFRIHRWLPVAGSAQACRQLEPLLGSDDARPLVIDLSGATWLSSLELGMLLMLGREGKARGYPVFCTGGTQRVARWMTFNGLDALMEPVGEGFDWVSAMKPCGWGDAVAPVAPGFLRLVLPREFTAARLAFWRERFDDALAEQGRRPLRVEVDASALSFIDSASLGYLVAFKQRVEQEGGRLVVLNLAGPARMTFRLARVEKLFGLTDA